MRHKKFTPYIRRANGREKAESLVIATRLAYYRIMKKPFYVMVQHGFPNLATAAQDSKREVEQTVLFVHMKRETFNQWARNIGKRCRG